MNPEPNASRPQDPAAGRSPSEPPKAPSLPPPSWRVRISTYITSLRPVAFRTPGTLPSVLPAANEAPAPAVPARPRRGPLVLGGVALVAAAAAVGWFATSSGDRRANEVRTGPVAGAPAVRQTPAGALIRWRDAAVTLGLDESARSLAPSLGAIFAGAADAWRASGAQIPSISTVPVSGAKAGYAQSGANQNVVLYAASGDPKLTGGNNPLAVTVLTYDSKSGAIVDADIVVNGKNHPYTVVDPKMATPGGKPKANDGPGAGDDDAGSGAYDLPSVLTHEMGHLLGLGEDYEVQTAAMYAYSKRGDVTKRKIASSDAQAVLKVYPHDEAVDAKKAGCGGAAVAGSRGGARRLPGPIGLAGLALGLAGLAALARSRQRQRRGFVFALAGATVLLAPPAAERAVAVPGHADADAMVVAAEPRWEDGILVTQLRLRMGECRVAACPKGEETVLVAGGSLDGVTQVVGAAPVPSEGARVAVALSALAGGEAPTMRLVPFAPMR